MADLFLKQAHDYRKGRPDYPQGIYDLLASLTSRHELAWDVGTGNGQAATVLAERYGRVVATDTSEQQLQQAEKRANICYVKTPARLSEEEIQSIVGEEGSVDLITVAQSLHWFDLDVFYDQVKRLLRKPGGVFAAWCYPRKPFVNPAVDEVYDEFDLTTLPYWAPQVSIIECGFQTLPFPFQALDERGVGPMEFQSVKLMSGLNYLQYLRSYSSVNTARSQGIELLDEALEKKILDAWGPIETLRNVTFPLFLVVGTVPHST